MCHSDKILAGHSLKGGTRAGHFDTLGETASMHACLQRCCSKHTCDVALLIDGRCYGVACFRKELCEAIPVPHPHFVFSQLGFVTKGQKRGDIEKNQGRRPTLSWIEKPMFGLLFFFIYLIIIIKINYFIQLVSMVSVQTGLLSLCHVLGKDTLLSSVPQCRPMGLLCRWIEI